MPQGSTWVAPANGVSVLKSDVPLPALLLRREDYRHNLRLMASYCQDKGIAFAPHAKSHLCPEIVSDQMDLGAWGVSVANVGQAKTFADAGIDRILIANQVVDRGSLLRLRQLLLAKPDVDIHLFVDSVACVEQIEATRADGLPSGRRVGAIIEVGIVGGRAGLRSIDDALPLAERIRRSRTLHLTGIGGYEGAVPVESGRSPRPAIEAYFRSVIAISGLLEAKGCFNDASEVILTMGGTTYFDYAAEMLAREHAGKGRLSLLRAGCYAFVDHGVYKRCVDRVYTEGSMRLHGKAIGEADGFRPALRVAAAVQSTPESGMAIAAMGKRDVACDIDLPVALAVAKSGGPERPLRAVQAAKLMDQHCYLADPERELAVGDIVLFGISHPCTTIDKHRVLFEVDEAHNVVRLLKTHFHDEA
jgi:D-serine dehydratase